MAVPDAALTLERELRGVFGARLRSLVVHGLHADAHAPVRTMAVVESLTEQDLRGCAARVPSWHAAGLATPLLVPSAELGRSLDAFPLEFSAIIADHVVVAGTPPFDGKAVDAVDIRRACEAQARSHLLHLREGFLETGGNRDALAVLVAQSASPLNALLASLARLDGRTDLNPEAAGRHAERTLSVSPGSITEVVKLARVHEISGADAERVFPPYLAAMQRLVEYVDNWARR